MKQNVTSISVAFIGDESSGKSTLLQTALSWNVPKNQQPTVGASFIILPFNFDRHKVKFQVWDTAGAIKYQPLLPLYISNRDYVVVCVFLKTFNPEQTEKLISQIMKNNKLKHMKFNMAFVGCGSDLVEAKAKIPLLTKFAAKYNSSYFITSAYNHTGLFDVFYHITSEILSKDN
ncbi:Ras-related protein rab-5b-related [Entamoeba marina]